MPKRREETIPVLRTIIWTIIIALPLRRVITVSVPRAIRASVAVTAILLKALLL
jgi:hypothetical protein